MKEPIAELNWKVGRANNYYEINDDYFIQRWKKGMKEGEKRILLEELSPDISRNTSRPANSKSNLAFGIILMLFAMVLFFSIVQSKVPLLSVLIGALGLWTVIKALRRFRMQTWTIFHKKSGSQFAHVMHKGCADDDRERFEEVFSDVVKQKQNQALEPISFNAG